MGSEIFREGLLDGQVIIVSGGGSGLGRTTARELAALGARVVICGRRLEPLEETVALAGGGVEPVVCDIREEDQVDALVDGVLERHGRIDLLVNNAGGQYMAGAESITPKGFRTVMRLNVEGTWLMTHAVATKAMIPAGHGKVVSITISPHNGMPGMAHSSAARAAVENLMKVLSIEWARHGVLLNAIAAGQFETQTLLTKYPKPIVDAMASTVPAQRLGREEEIAWLIAYLASPAGDFVSGAVLTVDGARDNWEGRWPPKRVGGRGGKSVRGGPPRSADHVVRDDVRSLELDEVPGAVDDGGARRRLAQDAAVVGAVQVRRLDGPERPPRPQGAVVGEDGGAVRGRRDRVPEVGEVLRCVVAGGPVRATAAGSGGRARARTPPAAAGSPCTRSGAAGGRRSAAPVAAASRAEARRW